MYLNDPLFRVTTGSTQRAGWWFEPFSPHHWEYSILISSVSSLDVHLFWYCHSASLTTKSPWTNTSQNVPPQQITSQGQSKSWAHGNAPNCWGALVGMETSQWSRVVGQHSFLGLRETCGQVDQVLFMSQRFAGVCFVAGGVLCRQGWQLTPGFYVTGQASHGKPASRDNVKFQMCQKGWYQGRLPTKWISHGLQRQIFLGRHFQLSAMIRLLLYTNSKSKRCQYICVLLFWEALWYIYEDECDRDLIPGYPEYPGRYLKHQS